MHGVVLRVCKFGLPRWDFPPFHSFVNRVHAAAMLHPEHGPAPPSCRVQHKHLRELQEHVTARTVARNEAPQHTMLSLYITVGYQHLPTQPKRARQGTQRVNYSHYIYMTAQECGLMYTRSLSWCASCAVCISLRVKCVQHICSAHLLLDIMTTLKTLRVLSCRIAVCSPQLQHLNVCLNLMILLPERSLGTLDDRYIINGTALICHCKLSPSGGS